jgi:hypothetical protein
MNTIRIAAVARIVADTQRLERERSASNRRTKRTAR